MTRSNSCHPQPKQRAHGGDHCHQPPLDSVLYPSVPNIGTALAVRCAYWLLVASATLLLSACATAPATQYYRLNDESYQIQHQHKPQMVLTVVVAEPLQGQALLYQPNEHTLHFAKQHLWAQPLAASIRNRLANELNQLNSQWTFVPAELKSASDTAVLTVYIDDFHGRYDGFTQISGYSKISLHGQNKAGNSFKVLTPQNGDGYAAMANALNQGLKHVAQDILP